MGHRKNRVLGFVDAVSPGSAVEAARKAGHPGVIIAAEFSRKCRTLSADDQKLLAEMIDGGVK